MTHKNDLTCLVWLNQEQYTVFLFRAVNEPYKAYKTHKNDLTCLVCLFLLNQEQVYRFLIPVR